MLNWSHMLFGIPVAIQTKGHAQRFGMFDNLHFIHATVTLNTAYTAVNVGSMVEVNVVRGFVNFDPLYRLA